jgi:hypothetical protein
VVGESGSKVGFMASSIPPNVTKEGECINEAVHGCVVIATDGVVEGVDNCRGSDWDPTSKRSQGNGRRCMNDK